MVPARTAELLELQPVLRLLLVLRRGVIAVLAFTALQGDDFAHAPFLYGGFQKWCSPDRYIHSEDAVPSNQQ